MGRRIRISARAAAEARKAAQWWLANRSSAPGAVGVDLDAAISLLAEQPGIGAPYEGARLPGVRRLYLGRIGYFLYYRATDDTLDVLALWHGRRKTQPRL